MKQLLTLVWMAAVIAPAYGQPAPTDEAQLWSGMPPTLLKATGPSVINDLVELAPGVVGVFAGPSFAIYDIAERSISESVPLLDSLPGWPTAWSKGLTASTEWDSITNILFKDSSMVWLDLTTLSVTSQPEPFEGLPPSWKGRIDAAVRWDAAQIYLFSGPEFMIWDLETDAVGDAMALKDWAGWPAGWTSCDAAINLGEGMIHFLRGQEVLVYDQGSGKFQTGYPKRINLTANPK